MKIEVTNDDIKNGLRYECGLCPVARAAGRAFQEERVSVTPGHMYVGYTETDHGKEFKLPSEATIFIFRFDRGDSVEPFTFEIGEPL